MKIAPEQQAQIAATCQRFQVRRLSLFGSQSRGDARDDSDVDLLIEFVPGAAPSAFRLIDLQDELSAAFAGKRVDMAFPAILGNPYRRATIEPSLRTLYTRD